MKPVKRPANCILWLIALVVFSGVPVFAFAQGEESATRKMMPDDGPDWWDARWRFRTTVARPAPNRNSSIRPIEVAVDFPLLLKRAGIQGDFDPASVRVVRRGPDRAGELPYAFRTEFDAPAKKEQSYLAWYSVPVAGSVGEFDLYFDTIDTHQQRPPRAAWSAGLPSENLVADAGFEDATGGIPAKWNVSAPALVRLGHFEHTTGRQSLKVVVDEHTPEDTPRDVRISQSMDIRAFAGQEMVFRCDLLAERAAYGVPVGIELQQFRADGSRIPEFAVDPRWLTIELAEGQLVQFNERGRFSADATTVTLVIRICPQVLDSDTGQVVTGPESFFTVWVDNVIVRPGERWPWPAASHGGFVEGPLEGAPVNRAFEFTGQRRLVFNGASEGTLMAGIRDAAPDTVHWGMECGTLEFWCRPNWNPDDGEERIFFVGVAYSHRQQSFFRKLGASGGNQLAFTIRDSDRQAHTISGPAPLHAGQWHHVAVTWSFPQAHMQLFVDGRRIASVGPGAEPWPSSLAREGKYQGIGVSADDSRSLPMQAFIGGERTSFKAAAEAALDEFRVSDVVRYDGPFTPARREFPLDPHTRALFHFENEEHGVHAGDDGFVRGSLGCELPRQQEAVPLETLIDGRVEQRMVTVKPHASEALFAANRAENHLIVERPFVEPPDPRFIEYREKRFERVVNGAVDVFNLQVGGDYAPQMRWITFEHAGMPAATTLLPRWRANDNVVPFSFQTLAATMAPRAGDDVEKALAVFKYAMRVTNYYNAGSYCETLPMGGRTNAHGKVVRAINIYPYHQCGPLNDTLRKLFLAAGISSNDALGTHHRFQQAFYGGSWRLFDASPRVFWLDRDNATVISRRAYEEDIHLKVRHGSSVHSALRGPPRKADFGQAVRPNTMDFAMRPGERIAFCWHNEGLWPELTVDRQPVLPLAKVPPSYGNGTITYQPVARGEAADLDNLVLAGRDLRPRDSGKPAAMTYRLACPYMLSDVRVDGSYNGRNAGDVRLALSFDDGRTWTEAWRSPTAVGNFSAADLRSEVAARYVYWIRLELSSGATVRDLSLRTTFVASPMALPETLALGGNRCRTLGETGVPVKVAGRWVERHKSDLGVSLNALGFYTIGDEAYRNLYVVAPGGEISVQVTLDGRPVKGEVRLENLPRGWISEPQVVIVTADKPGDVRFTVRTAGTQSGDVGAFAVVVNEGRRERRIQAQALVAETPLVRPATGHDGLTGAARVDVLPGLVGGTGVAFSGDGGVAYDIDARRGGRHALWARVRWEGGSDTRLQLSFDGGPVRELQGNAQIGFSDWNDPGQAHSKAFAHGGEFPVHWLWYRIPDVALTPGKHRLVIGAGKGTCIDALALLPQEAAMDRAAMNLFQNWNYEPWENPQAVR